MLKSESNILTEDQFFDDKYWDAVEHSNTAYIEKVALYPENYTPSPNAEPIYGPVRKLFIRRVSLGKGRTAGDRQCGV